LSENDQIKTCFQQIMVNKAMDLLNAVKAIISHGILVILKFETIVKPNAGWWF